MGWKVPCNSMQCTACNVLVSCKSVRMHTDLDSTVKSYCSTVLVSLCGIRNMS